MPYPPRKYLGGGEVAAAIMRRPDQPPDLEMGKGSRLYYLATEATTDGEAGLIRCEFPGPPSGALPHFHTSFSEWFYVLSGTMQFYDGQAWMDGTPGDFLLFPEGGIHGFRNQSGAHAEMLLGYAPGAPREEFFAGFADLEAGIWRPGRDELAEFMRLHDTFMT